MCSVQQPCLRLRARRSAPGTKPAHIDDRSGQTDAISELAKEDFMRALVVGMALTLLASGGAIAQASGAAGVAADAVKWGPAPPVLPKGGQMAVLSGDPGKPGLFTVRLKMPAGYKIQAHQHPHSEPVTVISGELHF